MRSAHGRWWVVTQFFAVSIAQHGMLVCAVPCPPPRPPGVSNRNQSSSIYFAPHLV